MTSFLLNRVMVAFPGNQLDADLGGSGVLRERFASKLIFGLSDT
jgi:hypothetical protein